MDGKELIQFLTKEWRERLEQDGVLSGEQNVVELLEKKVRRRWAEVLEEEGLFERIRKAKEIENKKEKEREIEDIFDELEECAAKVVSEFFEYEDGVVEYDEDGWLAVHVFLILPNEEEIKILFSAEPFCVSIDI